MKNIKDETINKLKKKIKKLNQEVSYLNDLLMDADDSSWDTEIMYKDARDGTFNGHEIDGKPDKKFAEWIANRYNLKLDEEGGENE